MSGYLPPIVPDGQIPSDAYTTFVRVLLKDAPALHDALIGKAQGEKPKKTTIDGVMTNVRQIYIMNLLPEKLALVKVETDDEDEYYIGPKDDVLKREPKKGGGRKSKKSSKKSRKTKRNRRY